MTLLYWLLLPLPVLNVSVIFFLSFILPGFVINFFLLFSSHWNWYIIWLNRAINKWWKMRKDSFFFLQRKIMKILICWCVYYTLHGFDVLIHHTYITVEWMFNLFQMILYAAVFTAWQLDPTYTNNFILNEWKYF